MGRLVDGGGFLVEIAKKIVERLVDLHVHIDGDVRLDRLEFHIDASTEEGGAAEKKKVAAHNQKIARNTPGGNSVSSMRLKGKTPVDSQLQDRIERPSHIHIKGHLLDRTSRSRRLGDEPHCRGTAFVVAIGS